MADKAFKLEIISPDRVVYSDEDVASVVMPGIEGYLGVLGNHSPLMTELAIGELDFRRVDGSEDSLALAGGFAEVFENVVTVLAEVAEMREEINVERAESARNRAEERIAAHAPEIDLERAEIALKKALNRLNVARHGR